MSHSRPQRQVARNRSAHLFHPAVEDILDEFVHLAMQQVLAYPLVQWQPRLRQMRAVVGAVCPPREGAEHDRYFLRGVVVLGIGSGTDLEASIVNRSEYFADGHMVSDGARHEVRYSAHILLQEAHGSGQRNDSLPGNLKLWT